MTYLGHHTEQVKRGLTIGFALFIVSELMAFLSIFWAYFHSSLSPAVEIGGTWPKDLLFILILIHLFYVCFTSNQKLLLYLLKNLLKLYILLFICLFSIKIYFSNLNLARDLDNVKTYLSATLFVRNTNSNDTIGNLRKKECLNIKILLWKK